MLECIIAATSPHDFFCNFVCLLSPSLSILYRTVCLMAAGCGGSHCVLLRTSSGGNLSRGSGSVAIYWLQGKQSCVKVGCSKASACVIEKGVDHGTQPMDLTICSHAKLRGSLVDMLAIIVLLSGSLPCCAWSAACDLQTSITCHYLLPGCLSCAPGCGPCLLPPQHPSLCVGAAACHQCAGGGLPLRTGLGNTHR